jgi:integrase
MNFTKRGKGRKASYSYRFMWTVKNADGTSESLVIRRSAKGATNIEAAREAADEHRRALRLGLVHPKDPWPPAKAPEAAPVTFRQFGTRFLEHAKLHTKEGTARFYEECLERALKFAPLADASLKQITSENIAQYSSWRKAAAEGNAVATINAEIRTIRRLLNLAEEWGELDKAPACHELPGQKGRDRVLSFTEEAAYLKHATPNLRDATILAVDTGVRPDSELFLLEWRNVHLEKTTEAPNGYIHVEKGKTKYAVRNVPLTARARAVLDMRASTAGDNRYVFPGDGSCGHLVSLQHPHGEAIKDAALVPFEFYCWRHTFGTRAAESGMDKFSLARLMGHSSPRVAERYYIHVTEPHVTAGFGKFADYVAAKQVEAFPAASEKVQ